MMMQQKQNKPEHTPISFLFFSSSPSASLQLPCSSIYRLTKIMLVSPKKLSIEMESTDSSGSQLQHQLPPGFRFHPTDEELVVHYLKRKAASAPLPVSIIAEVDLYKFDPWELPGKANFGEQEWYFFSPRERKYPNGARPNRAATSGYWKATGTDKPILSSSVVERGSSRQMIKVGVKKALVFYGGKPPKGIKTNWIMHEYRLTDGNTTTTTSSTPSHHGNRDGNSIPATGKKASLRLDDWVLCRIYKKNNSSSSNNSCSTQQQQQRLLMERDSDNSSLDNMYSAPPSLLPTHPHVPAAISQRQPNPQLRLQLHHHHRQGATNTNYTALLHNDDAFFEGLLTNNTCTGSHDQDAAGVHSTGTTDSITTAIHLGVSATAGGLAKRELRTSPYSWCDAAGKVNPPASKRFQLPYNIGNTSSNSNNSSTNIINNHNVRSTANTATDDGGHSMETFLGNQNIIVQQNSPNYNHHVLGSFQDEGASGSVFHQVPYQLSSTINWSS